MERFVERLIRSAPAAGGCLFYINQITSPLFANTYFAVLALFPIVI
jgi:hypothetical protein